MFFRWYTEFLAILRREFAWDPGVQGGIHELSAEKQINEICGPIKKVMFIKFNQIECAKAVCHILIEKNEQLSDSYNYYTYGRVETMLSILWHILFPALSAEEYPSTTSLFTFEQRDDASDAAKVTDAFRTVLRTVLYRIYCLFASN